MRYKKYYGLVEIYIPEYEELEVAARNRKEAIKKMKKIVNRDFKYEGLLDEESVEELK